MPVDSETKPKDKLTTNPRLKLAIIKEHSSAKSGLGIGFIIMRKESQAPNKAAMTHQRLRSANIIAIFLTRLLIPAIGLTGSLIRHLFWI